MSVESHRINNQPFLPSSKAHVKQQAAEKCHKLSPHCKFNHCSVCVFLKPQVRGLAPLCSASIYPSKKSYGVSLDQQHSCWVNCFFIQHFWVTIVAARAWPQAIFPKTHKRLLQICYSYILLRMTLLHKAASVSLEKLRAIIYVFSNICNLCTHVCGLQHWSLFTIHHELF